MTIQYQIPVAHLNVASPPAAIAGASVMYSEGGVLKWKNPSGTVFPLDTSGHTLSTLATTGYTAGSIPFIGPSGTVIEDNAGLFYDATNDYLGIGTSAPAFALNIASDTFAVLSFDAFGSGSGQRLQFRRAFGTRAAPTVVNANSVVIGAVSTYAYDGTTYQSSGVLNWTLDGVPSGSDYPTRFGIYVHRLGDTAGLVTEQFTLKNNGWLGVGNVGPAARLHVLDTPTDSTVSGNIPVLIVGRNSLVPNVTTNGFGAGIQTRLSTSASNNTNASYILTEWIVATNASQKARLSLSVYDNLVPAHEGLRIDALGAGVVGIGVLGAAASPRITVSGSRSGIPALTPLLSAMATFGYITDSTTDATPGYVAPANGGTGSGPLTTGSIPFIGASGVYSEDNANLYWDASNKRLGVGTNVPAFPLHVSLTGSPTVSVDAFGGGAVPRLQLRRAGNAQGSPSGVTGNGITLGSFDIYGYGSGGAYQSAGSVSFLTDGTTSGDEIPARIAFSVHQAGDTAGVVTEQLTLKNDGKLGVGVTAPLSRLHVNDTDAATATILPVLTLAHNTSALPANVQTGFGASIITRLTSTTSLNQPASAIITDWASPTNASRHGRISFNVYDFGGAPPIAREGFKIESMTASAGVIGIAFFGGAAALKQTLAAAAGTDGTSLQALVNSIRTALINYGLA